MGMAQTRRNNRKKTATSPKCKNDETAASKNSAKEKGGTKIGLNNSFSAGASVESKLLVGPLLESYNCVPVGFRNQMTAMGVINDNRSITSELDFAEMLFDVEYEGITQHTEYSPTLKSESFNSMVNPDLRPLVNQKCAPDPECREVFEMTISIENIKEEPVDFDEVNLSSQDFSSQWPTETLLLGDHIKKEIPVSRAVTNEKCSDENEIFVIWDKSEASSCQNKELIDLTGLPDTKLPVVISNIKQEKNFSYDLSPKTKTLSKTFVRENNDKAECMKVSEKPEANEETWRSNRSSGLLFQSSNHSSSVRPVSATKYVGSGIHALNTDYVQDFDDVNLSSRDFSRKCLTERFLRDQVKKEIRNDEDNPLSTLCLDVNNNTCLEENEISVIWDKSEARSCQNRELIDLTGLSDTKLPVVISSIKQEKNFSYDPSPKTETLSKTLVRAINDKAECMKVSENLKANEETCRGNQSGGVSSESSNSSSFVHPVSTTKYVGSGADALNADITVCYTDDKIKGMKLSRLEDTNCQATSKRSHSYIAPSLPHAESSSHSETQDFDICTILPNRNVQIKEKPRTDFENRNKNGHISARKSTDVKQKTLTDSENCTGNDCILGRTSANIRIKEEPQEDSENCSRNCCTPGREATDVTIKEGPLTDSVNCTKNDCTLVSTNIKIKQEPLPGYEKCTGNNHLLGRESTDVRIKKEPLTDSEDCTRNGYAPNKESVLFTEVISDTSGDGSLFVSSASKEYRKERQVRKNLINSSCNVQTLKKATDIQLSSKNLSHVDSTLSSKTPERINMSKSVGRKTSGNSSEENLQGLIRRTTSSSSVNLKLLDKEKSVKPKTAKLLCKTAASNKHKMRDNLQGSKQVTKRMKLKVEQFSEDKNMKKSHRLSPIAGHLKPLVKEKSVKPKTDKLLCKTDASNKQKMRDNPQGNEQVTKRVKFNGEQFSEDKDMQKSHRLPQVAGHLKPLVKEKSVKPKTDKLLCKIDASNKQKMRDNPQCNKQVTKRMKFNGEQFSEDKDMQKSHSLPQVAGHLKPLIIEKSVQPKTDKLLCKTDASNKQKMHDNPQGNKQVTKRMKFNGEQFSEYKDMQKYHRLSQVADLVIQSSECKNSRKSSSAKSLCDVKASRVSSGQDANVADVCAISPVTVSPQDDLCIPCSQSSHVASGDFQNRGINDSNDTASANISLHANLKAKSGLEGSVSVVPNMCEEAASSHVLPKPRKAEMNRKELLVSNSGINSSKKQFSFLHTTEKTEIPSTRVSQPCVAISSGDPSFALFEAKSNSSISESSDKQNSLVPEAHRKQRGKDFTARITTAEASKTSECRDKMQRKMNNSKANGSRVKKIDQCDQPNSDAQNNHKKRSAEETFHKKSKKIKKRTVEDCYLKESKEIDEICKGKDRFHLLVDEAQTSNSAEVSEPNKFDSAPKMKNIPESKANSTEKLERLSKEVQSLSSIKTGKSDKEIPELEQKNNLPGRTLGARENVSAPVGDSTAHLAKDNLPHESVKTNHTQKWKKSDAKDSDTQVTSSKTKKERLSDEANKTKKHNFHSNNASGNRIPHNRYRSQASRFHSKTSWLNHGYDFKREPSIQSRRNVRSYGNTAFHNLLYESMRETPGRTVDYNQERQLAFLNNDDYMWSHRVDPFLLNRDCFDLPRQSERNFQKFNIHEASTPNTIKFPLLPSELQNFPTKHYAPVYLRDNLYFMPQKTDSVPSYLRY